ncbi:hypothetical protein CQA66_04270 [Helicobacter aurati]|uniref:TonB C-terminal domain-containing protein n=1 Tax=Helicobacter aurati TaxID=137778 RepID=A0A3D8J6L0_9HELI|nr:hypothetical protein [Helicobacter aurati]RDU72534.1 hypothetical protein CQA66_04270 [Helicobacter aurati]
MDIILAMLASNTLEKLEERKWGKFPYNVQKNLEINQTAHNFALYRYLVNNAIRYPKEWVDNGYGASVVASIEIYSQSAILRDVRVLHKTQGLTQESIFNEVEKTLQRAKFDFPNTESEVTLSLPLEWKSVRTF